MWKLTFFALGVLGLIALVVGPKRRQAIKKRLFLAAVATLAISLALRTGRYLLDQHRGVGESDGDESDDDGDGGRDEAGKAAEKAPESAAGGDAAQAPGNDAGQRSPAPGHVVLP